MTWREKVLRTLDYSTRPALFNKYSITALVFMSELFHLLASGDLPEGFLFQRIVAAALSVIPALICVYLIQHIATRKPLGQRIILVVVSYVIAGLTRGISLSLMLEWLDLISFSESLWRIPTGVTLIGTAMGLINYLSCVVMIQNDIAANLSDQNERLQASFKQLEATSQRESRDEIRGIVGTILGNMDGISLKQNQNQIAEVEQLVTEYIRPLTREIATSMPQWKPENLLSARPKISEAFMKIDMLNLLPTVALGVLIAWVRIPGAIKHNGVAYALIEASISSLIYLLTAPRISKFIVGLTNPNTVITKLLVIIGLLIATAVPINLVQLALAHNSNVSVWLPWSIYLGLMTFGALSVFSKSALEQTLIQTKRLEAIEKQLAWMIARVNLLGWHNRGIVARVLHGPIQNSFQATLIRMRSGSQQDSHQVLDDLQKRLSDIEQIPVSSKSMSVELHELQQLWREIASITFDFPAEVENVDDASRAIALDLVQETVSNAVRHGGAMKIDIEARIDNDILTLKISDNGTAKRIDTPAGMGSQMLDACTVTQVFEHNGDVNSLEVTLPVVIGDARSK